LAGSAHPRLAWAWRIPFLISIALVGVGLYIRMQLEETPVFRDIKAKREVAKLPLVEVLTRHRHAFFTAVGLDRGRDAADLGLPDRARRHHVHRHDGCARNRRQTTELMNTHARCAGVS